MGDVTPSRSTPADEARPVDGPGATDDLHIARLLRLASDSLPIGIVIWDERARSIVYRNDVFLRVWGLLGAEERQRVAALDGAALLAECAGRVAGDRDARERWQQVCRGGIVEDEVALRDGRHLRICTQPLPDEGGVPRWQLCTFEQITKRKQSEALLLVQRDLAQALSATSDMPALLNAALDAVLQIAGIDCAGIYLVDEQTGGLELAAHRGFMPAFVDAVARYPADAPQARLVLAGRPCYAGHHDVMARTGVVTDEARTREGLRALAVVPVLHEGRVIACLNSASHASDHIPVAARRALEAIAGQIGGAIARAKAEGARIQSEEELRRKEEAERRFGEQLLALHEAEMDLLRTESVDDLCRRTVELARERLGFERVGIWLRDGDSGYVLGSFGTGEDGALRDERGQRLYVIPNSPLARVLSDRERVVRVSDAPLRDCHGEEIGRGARVLAAIWDGREVLGAITADNFFSGRAFSDEDGQILGLLAAVVGHIHLRHRMERMRRLAEDLLAADQQKNEFLAMLSHELRNPLGAITAAIHLLGAQGADQERRQRTVEVARRQAGHMGRILDDLLDLSRVAAGKIHLRVERVSLQAAVASAVDAVRPQLDERRHALEVQLPPEPLFVEADPTRLEQILWNLLTNASRYTPPGGRIRVEASRRERHAEVRVADNGEGMPPEAIERVFEPFVQLRRGDGEAQRGLGIGLALVRRLVEMHGGDIQARSPGPGMGSEFLFSLPLSAVQSEADAPAAPADNLLDANPRRVLLVDDDPDGAEVLGDLIAVWGHDVRIAHDGYAAIEAALACPPDVVLLDIDLPGMDGWDVGRRLRRLSVLSRTVLVAVTGHGLDRDRRRAAEAGFNHFLTKPADPLQLHRLLAEAAPSGEQGSARQE